jgi:hypothetical protein
MLLFKPSQKPMSRSDVIQQSSLCLATFSQNLPVQPDMITGVSTDVGERLKDAI